MAEAFTVVLFQMLMLKTWTRRNFYVKGKLQLH